MKQSKIAWKLLLAAGLAFPLGCTADGAQVIQILRNQVPEPGCIASGNDSMLFRSRGVIDAAANRGYVFTPLVQSDAVANDVAPRRFFLEGADVDITFVGDNTPTVSADLTSFRTLASGSLEANSTTGYIFEIVPKDLLLAIADDVATDRVELVASVTLVGDLEGNSVESNTFNYPISVCSGCLINNLGPCSEVDDTLEISQGGICNDFQDEVTDCCEENGALVCPAVPSDPIITP